MRTPLTVYKASAGSGKTFTLAIEYIKLLINNPTSYRNTLAVTFTNKATEEMKMRILSQLYGIWKMLPDSDNYTEKITKELNVSREFASERAGQALSFLIHDYSNFKVETIDSSKTFMLPVRFFYGLSVTFKRMLTKRRVGTSFMTSRDLD